MDEREAQEGRDNNPYDDAETTRRIVEMAGELGALAAAGIYFEQAKTLYGLPLGTILRSCGCTFRKRSREFWTCCLRGICITARASRPWPQGRWSALMTLSAKSRRRPTAGRSPKQRQISKRRPSYRRAGSPATERHAGAHGVQVSEFKRTVNAGADARGTETMHKPPKPQRDENGAPVFVYAEDCDCSVCVEQRCKSRLFRTSPLQS